MLYDVDVLLYGVPVNRASPPRYYCTDILSTLRQVDLPLYYRN